MNISREQFYKGQAVGMDEILNACGVIDASESREHFLRLSMDSFDAAEKLEIKPPAIYFLAVYASCLPAYDFERFGLHDLATRWTAWGLVYKKLSDCYPLLEMRNRLQRWSESLEGLSFPQFGLSQMLFDHMSSAGKLHPEIKDYNHDFDRLLVLCKRAGYKWLFRDDDYYSEQMEITPELILACENAEEREKKKEQKNENRIF